MRLIDEHLKDPLRWKRPRRIFVNSMSDLFHESIPDKWIYHIFDVMYSAKHHVFQVLTKRPDRMLQIVANSMYLTNAPLPNVWLGVSVEDQKTADERIPVLLETPAAVRFISYEPALGPINIARYLGCADPDHRHSGPCSLYGADRRLGWVIVGGESGAGARPCALEWISSVVYRCKLACVPVFVKQLGAFVVSEERTAPEEFMKQADYKGPFLKAPNGEIWAWRAGLRNRKGGDLAEFPVELQVREFPDIAMGGA